MTVLDRRSALLLLGGGVLAGCSSPAEGAPSTAVVPAAGVSSSRTLRDFVGVNAHWDYPDTPYGQRYTEVRNLLHASGIRHVRGELSRAADLARYRIRTTLLVDEDHHGDGDPVQIVRSAAKLAAAGAIGGFEAPNEPDYAWIGEHRTYGGQSYPRAVLAWQQDLYRAVKSSAATRKVPVIGLSFGKTYWDGGHPFHAGELASSCDWGNFHPYAGGNPFTRQYRYAGIDDYYNNADFPSVTLDRAPINVATYRPAFGNRPMAATEMGYSTWRLGQSERVQGWYTVRTVLEFLRLGIQRVYLYEFVDEWADDAGENDQAHFGLLRNNLTPKPAYTALRTLLSVAGDAVPRSAAALSRTGFTYRLTVRPPAGYDAAQVHRLALRRPDGKIVIALWHEVSADDLSPKNLNPPQPIREVAQPEIPVTVEISPGARAQRAEVYVIGDDGRAQQGIVSRTARTLQLPVTGRVTLLLA